MSISDFSFDFNFDSDSNDDENHQLSVIIADAGSDLGLQATRAFLKNLNATKLQQVLVTALVEDEETDFARQLKSLGAKIVKYSHSDTNSVRKAFSESSAHALVLIPPATQDLVIRVNTYLSQIRHTSIRSVYFWSFIGTDEAMSLPPDMLPATDPLSSDRPIPNSLTLLKEAEELVMHALPDQVHRVIVRSGFPLQVFLPLSTLIQNRGAVPFTSDSANVAPIDSSDVGRAISRLFDLGNGDIPEDRRGMTITLTGVEAQSGPMIVTLANSGLSQPLAFAKVSMSDMRAFLLQTHMSPFNLSLVLGWWHLFTNAKLELVTPDLQDILGGPNKLASIADFFAHHAQQFLPSMERIPGDWNIIAERPNTTLSIFDAYVNNQKAYPVTCQVNNAKLRNIRLMSIQDANRSGDTLHLYELGMTTANNASIGDRNSAMMNQQSKLGSITSRCVEDVTRSNIDEKVFCLQKEVVLFSQPSPEPTPPLDYPRHLSETEIGIMMEISDINLDLFGLNQLHLAQEHCKQITKVLSFNAQIMDSGICASDSVQCWNNIMSFTNGVLEYTKVSDLASPPEPVCDSMFLVQHKANVQKAVAQMSIVNDLLATIVSTLQVERTILHNKSSHLYDQPPCIQSMQNNRSQSNGCSPCQCPCKNHLVSKSSQQGRIAAMVLRDVGQCIANERLGVQSCGSFLGQSVDRDINCNDLAAGRIAGYGLPGCLIM